MFVPKNFVEIVSGMMTHMKSTQKAVTDYHIGSVARTLIESPAIEMEALYQAMRQGITDAIPVALYQAFDFGVLPPTCAGGRAVLISEAPTYAPITIPAGTIIKRSSPTLEYRTLTDAVFPQGTGVVNLFIGATLAGSAGNAPVGTVFTVDGSFQSKLTINALDRMIGGTDGESETERKARFIDYVGSLSRSTLNSLRYSAGQSVVKNAAGAISETVARVGLIEEAGRVAVYLYGSHGTASSALIAVAQAAMDEIRPAGVQIDVLQMGVQAVDAAFQVKLFAGQGGGAPTIDAIKTAFSGLLSVIRPGEVLYVSAMIDAALAVSGVERVLCNNNSNITCPQNIVLIMGTVSVLWM